MFLPPQKSLTRELVYANITIVMEMDRKKITEENLIRCGREEFLEKGYSKANLREICRRAGVTTGAFYFSFENKEALLGAILEPVVTEYRTMMYEIAKREQEHPETAEANERQIMEYICAHRQECELVLEKCSGSKYEAFRDEVFSNMVTAFQGYYEKQLGFIPDTELLRILATMRFHGFLELIKGDYNMDYRLFLTKAIGIHADAGTQSLIAFLKSKNDAHR